MALSEYNRSLDQGRLVRDANLEVLEVFYPPHFEDIDDAGVGNSDLDKVGAICTVKDGADTKVAVYQGGGVFKIVGGERHLTIINVDPGTNIYSLIWTEELKNKHGPVPREPTVLVKAVADPPDMWTLLRSTVKFVLDGDGELSQMNVTISNLQAKIIIQ